MSTRRSRASPGYTTKRQHPSRHTSAGAAAVTWLAAGFVIPLTYLLGITAVTAVLSRGVPAQVRVRLPLVLVTMHMCWGTGFLTSPPGLHRVRSRSTTARKGHVTADARE